MYRLLIVASRSIRSSGGRSSRSGMRALVDALSEPRPKSPASQVDNDEPIELAHYPDAMKPPPGAKPPIERDDFPAPPYPYTDPERRRRWSDTYKVCFRRLSRETMGWTCDIIHYGR